MRNNDRRLRSRHTTASQENRAAWLFLLPSLIGVLLFVLLPFVETIRRSMFDTMGSTWVGFSNYDSVLQNDAFQLAVANTARFLGICLPLLLSGSLILALVLHSRPLRETKAARVFKTTSYYKVVVIRVPLQGQNATIDKVLWIGLNLLPQDGFRKAPTMALCF